MLMKILLGYLIVNTLIWIRRHGDVTRGSKNSPTLDSTYPVGDDDKRPRVSVIVPARNESANIEQCLSLLLTQTYENLEIIAVNDRSDDDTGAIMDRMAAGSDGRLRAVHVEEVADGWLGKPNAMRTAYEHATGDYICFMDADCKLVCPDAIRIAIQYAIDKKADLLSILPIFDTGSFWEHVLQPVCGAVLMFWFRPERVNDPADKRAYANGAYMQFRREAYEGIGGIAAAKGHVNEDMMFGRLIKQSGRRLLVTQNRDMLRIRMYDGFADTFTGWSRIYYGCFGKLGLVIGAAVLLAVMSVLPYLVFLTSVVLTALRGGQVSNPMWWIVGASATAITMQLSVLMRLYKLLGAGSLRSLTYPLGAVVTVLILANAASKFLGGSITWRGRRIDTGR